MMIPKRIIHPIKNLHIMICDLHKQWEFISEDLLVETCGPPKPFAQAAAPGDYGRVVGTSSSASMPSSPPSMSAPISSLISCFVTGSPTVLGIESPGFILVLICWSLLPGFGWRGVPLSAIMSSDLHRPSSTLRRIVRAFLMPSCPQTCPQGEQRL